MSDRPFFAFVLMPFDPAFEDIYKIGIKEAAAKAGIHAERLDEQMFAEGMVERIYRQIEAADIIIADVSSRNPNVFYEIGYAHAKDKLTILITRDAEDIPFDLKQRRHIVYGDSISHLREDLAKNLEWAKSEIENVRQSQIRVAFKGPVGILDTDDNFAKATLDFEINLHNDSKRPSPEISAIYFYAGNPWAIEQNNEACPRTESDLPDFKYRYFLHPPVSRLDGKAWAQLTFTAKRTIANRYRGDKILPEYPIRGKSILRFATSSGNFDYEISLDTTISEIPF